MHHYYLSSGGQSGASYGTFSCTAEHWQLADLRQPHLNSTSASSAFVAFTVVVGPHFTFTYVAIALDTAGLASAAIAVRFVYFPTVD